MSAKQVFKTHTLDNQTVLVVTTVTVVFLVMPTLRSGDLYLLQ